MVHSVGGTLLKHLEEHHIQGNRSQHDVLMYYTTVGWMMWNWMVSALALGNFQNHATLLYTENKNYDPTNAILWTNFGGYESNPAAQI